MKILVISDSHGQTARMQNVIEVEKPEKVFHLSDSQQPMDFLKHAIGDYETYCVRGNCDFDMSYPTEQILEIGKHKLLLCHGHIYGVKYDLDGLKEAAIKKGCDVALFGHTHIPHYEEGDVVMANPGSITLPRQEGHTPTYMIFNIEDDGKMTFDIKYLK